MTDRWDNFIAGEMIAPAAGRYVEAAHPATGRAGASVAASATEDVAAAVDAATAAAPAWRDRRPIERGRILTAIAAAIRAEATELVAIESAETGKPGWHAALEVEVAAQYFEYYAGLVNLFQGEKIDLGAGYHSYTIREPFGVVGVITPWNAPLNQAARGIAPALAAGNTIVAKPSEFTSGTTVAVARMAVEKCGLPPGVWNVVLGTGAEAGSSLVNHPRVRKIAFTGSVRAGRAIAHIAADRLIPLTLELGGKSPNIVFADADLAQAIPGAIRAFAVNAGQVCIAGSRLLIDQSIHDVFVQQLAKVVDDLPVGPSAGAFVGPITTRAQYDKVQEYIAIAEGEGARCVAGKTPPGADWGDGWYVRPTVFAGVTNDMRIAREEVFGPVLSVIPFATEEEAIELANDTEYGLAAGIWTQNLSRAHRVAAALQAGQIYVNEYLAGGVETPLGGYKNSGYGREKGIEALHHYTQLKCVTIKL
jgi:aldehyde dehydrogenase (NAD+)